MQCWSLRFNRQKKRRLLQCHETDFDFQTWFQKKHACRRGNNKWESRDQPERYSRGVRVSKLTNRHPQSPGLAHLGRHRQMAVIRLVHFPERQGVISWLETKTTVAREYLKSTARVYWTFVVLRMVRIHVIATKHGNDTWNQKSTHRGKLLTEQVNAEQRPGFLQHQNKVRQTHKSTPGISWQHRQRTGVHVQVTNCTSHNKEIFEGTAVLRRGFSGDASTEELSSPKIGSEGEPGLAPRNQNEAGRGDANAPLNVLGWRLSWK